MKVICILCEQPFIPTKLQVKKLRKHPHKIIICSDCYERVGKKLLNAGQNQELRLLLIELGL